MAGEPAEVMGLRVAGLGLWLDARDAGLRLVPPDAFVRFLEPKATQVGEPGPGPGDLVLRVRNRPLPAAPSWEKRLCVTDIWELWRDEAGCYVFVAPRQSPPRWVVVDPGFTAGEVLGDFSQSNGEGTYPLQALDIRLFLNWLATGGDVLLHAAGVAIDGEGYCFAGPSGVGKSTLAAALARDPSVTVLGEDQVIVRYLNGRFVVYGTPWHTDPALYAPQGVPLKKLFLLDRTAVTGAAQCPSVDGITRLLQTAFVPYYRPLAVTAILDRLALLAEQVPFYTLNYQLGVDVTDLVRQA
jgi:hypothetical protein